MLRPRNRTPLRPPLVGDSLASSPSTPPVARGSPIPARPVPLAQARSDSFGSAAAPALRSGRSPGSSAAAAPFPDLSPTPGPAQASAPASGLRAEPLTRVCPGRASCASGAQYSDTALHATPGRARRTGAACRAWSAHWHASQRPATSATSGSASGAATGGRRQSLASARQTESGGPARGPADRAAASRHGRAARASARRPALRRRRVPGCRPLDRRVPYPAVRFIPVRFVRASR